MEEKGRQNNAENQTNKRLSDVARDWERRYIGRNK